MTNRERSMAVLRYQPYDRLPVVHFGFWQETLEKWASEGHITEEQANNWIDGNVIDGKISPKPPPAFSRWWFRRKRRSSCGPIAFQAMGSTTDEIVRHATEIHQIDPLLAVKVVANKTGLPAISAYPITAWFEGASCRSGIIWKHHEE